jgi:hypothetical protein
MVDVGTDTGPFLCDGCGAVFSSANALNDHKAREAHASDRGPSGPFACGECGKSFDTLLDLSAHGRERHPPVPPMETAP